MKKNAFFSLTDKVPVLLLVIWISLIGYFIWQRVNQSDRPPIDDALSYYEKARNFWENVNKGFHRNPFNLSPTERPPGTVLLSYPFGFIEDHHGFLFRSIFIPFLIWIVSILILIWPAREEGKTKSYWPVTVTIFLLGPLPFFFQFDYGLWAYWGLMDSFFAAISALSLALTIKSLEKRSTSWLIAAVLATSICPLIKPMGYVIFLMIGLFWSINVFSIFSQNNTDNKAQIKFWWLGSGLFFLTGIIDLYLGISSQYLGQGTLSNYAHSMSVLNQDTKAAIQFKIFFLIACDTVGPQFLIYLSFFLFSLYQYI